MVEIQSKRCENYCPKCESNNVDWGDTHYTNNENYQEAVCLDCGCEFKEWRAYIETEWLE